MPKSRLAPAAPLAARNHQQSGRQLRITQTKRHLPIRLDQRTSNFWQRPVRRHRVLWSRTERQHAMFRCKRRFSACKPGKPPVLRVRRNHRWRLHQHRRHLYPMYRQARHQSAHCLTRPTRDWQTGGQLRRWIRHRVGGLSHRHPNSQLSKNLCLFQVRRRWQRPSPNARPSKVRVKRRNWIREHHHWMSAKPHPARRPAVTTLLSQGLLRRCKPHPLQGPGKARTSFDTRGSRGTAPIHPQPLVRTRPRHLGSRGPQTGHPVRRSRYQRTLRPSVLPVCSAAQGP